VRRRFESCRGHTLEAAGYSGANQYAWEVGVFDDLPSAPYGSCAVAVGVDHAPQITRGTRDIIFVVDAPVALLARSEDQLLTSDETDIKALLRTRRVKSTIIRV
jgi:hypothetical protein